MEKIRNGLIYLLILIVSFGVGVYVFDQHAMMVYVRHGQSKQIPDLTGQEVEAARLEARELGFGLKILFDEHSEEYPYDFVISQIPGAGSFSKRGRTIKVVRSVGYQRSVVPDVVDMAIRDAELAISTAGLIIEEMQSEYNDDILAGRVIRTIPAAGDTLFTGEKIEIVISKGSLDQEIQVPNFIGMDVDFINDIKADIALVIVFKYRRIPTIRENTVYQQSVLPGTFVARNSVITLLVSQGTN